MKQVFLCKRIYGENQVFEDVYLNIENNKIHSISKESTDEYVDYSGYNIIPGIIDIHNHGYMGWSATARDEDTIYNYSKVLASAGVTGVLPTTHELNSLDIISRLMEKSNLQGAKILGIHCEGPYRSKKRMGASKGLKWPSPSLEYTKKMWDYARGKIRYITVAPEIENIAASVEFLQEKGVVISFGHTDANYEEMKQGINSMNPDAATHLGNAMRGIFHRDIGALGALLLDENIWCELIADFYHISPEMIEIYFKVKDMNKFILISDSSELAGLPAGTYDVNNRIRVIDSSGFIHLEDGTISGSSKPLIFGIANLVNRMKFNLEDVVPLFSLNPATILKLDHNKGSIKVGKDADFVVIDDDFNVIATYVEGRKVFDKGDNNIGLNPKMIKFKKEG